jgi:hypothetical protein
MDTWNGVGRVFSQVNMATEIRDGVVVGVWGRGAARQHPCTTTARSSWCCIGHGIMVSKSLGVSGSNADHVSTIMYMMYNKAVTAPSHPCWQLLSPLRGTLHNK